MNRYFLSDDTTLYCTLYCEESFFQKPRFERLLNSLRKYPRSLLADEVVGLKVTGDRFQKNVLFQQGSTITEEELSRANYARPLCQTTPFPYKVSPYEIQFALPYIRKNDRPIGLGERFEMFDQALQSDPLFEGTDCKIELNFKAGVAQKNLELLEEIIGKLFIDGKRLYQVQNQGVESLEGALNLFKRWTGREREKYFRAIFSTDTIRWELVSPVAQEFILSIQCDEPVTLKNIFKLLQDREVLEGGKALLPENKAFHHMPRFLPLPEIRGGYAAA